jgi:hypothetical protein
MNVLAGLVAAELVVEDGLSVLLCLFGGVWVVEGAFTIFPLACGFGRERKGGGWVKDGRFVATHGVDSVFGHFVVVFSYMLL